MVEITGLANRPKGIKPESVTDKYQKSSDCIVAFITVESGFFIKRAVPKAIAEIKKMATDVKSKNIVVYPFAHLSNNLAKYDVSLEIIKSISDGLSIEFNVIRAHFGSDKSLLLDIKGHKGNVRFRDF